MSASRKNSNSKSSQTNKYARRKRTLTRILAFCLAAFFIILAGVYIFIIIGGGFN